jgi:hypothetical protein
MKKLVYAFISGCMVFVLSWFYINSYFTLGIEDDLYKKLAVLRFLVFPDGAAQNDAQFLFINTGNDLALVDNQRYGNTAISDRGKITRLLNYLHKDGSRPLYTVLDLEFVLPSAADSLLQKAVDQVGGAITAPIEPDMARLPIRSPHPTITSYSTFSTDINKFKLYYRSPVRLPSLPLYLYNTLHPSSRVNTDGWFNTSGGHLCLNYVWPYYYLNSVNVPSDSVAQLGALLTALDAGFIHPRTMFDGRIVCIGDFTTDLHNTPVGKLPGTLVLADIYLTLLAGHHVVSYGWIVFSLLLFTMLSYFAWFKPLPEVNFRFNFIFSRHLADFLKGYVSFLGIMLLASVVSFFVFHIYINILFSAFVFSGIDYFSHKKYRNDHA